MNVNKVSTVIEKKVATIPAILIGTDMFSVFDHFRTHKEYNFFPILDTAGKPVGVVPEVKLKDYIFGMFGRELIRHRRLDEFLVFCPMISIETEPEDIIKFFGDLPNPYGLLLIDNAGIYKGVLPAQHILELYEENRVEMQKQLLQTQKMEAIGLLAGGIAHDFNNILVPILGYAEIARERLDPEASQIFQYLSKITESALRAKELISQILTFHRRSETDIAPFHITPLIKEVTKLLVSSVKSDITVRFDVRTDNDVVLVNPTRFNQVVMNLCTNAIYAMKNGGGELTISIDTFDTIKGWCGNTSIPGGKFMQLSVKDTGTGIDEEILPRIFEPYFTTKPQNEGTGMGLSVVHGIIKGFGGFISVESEPGHGTTFHIMLPMAENQNLTAEHKENVEKHNTKNIPEGKRILIIDDEPVILDVMKEILSKYGFDVTSFQNGEDSIKNLTLHSDAYDLIITDLSMPLINGLQLTAMIRTINSTVPILLCSGHVERFDITSENAIHYGINKVLQKPLKMKVLIEAVQELITN